MTKGKILWIEGKRANSPSFVPDLRRKGYLVEIAPSGEAALRLLPHFAPDVIVLDGASMRSSCKRLSHRLRQQSPSIPILFIAHASRPAPQDLPVDLVITLPFTLRKLLNRIRALAPPPSRNLLRRGPIHLDLEHKRVQCQGREGVLTPRMARLLKVLLEHPGQALERERLFREVWQTEYTADTRTLDVHISWLRQIIEADPHHPEFLKTVRGVGYLLDV